MNIFIQIKNSIYNKEYYKTVLNSPFRDSLKYLAKLSLLVSLVITVVFAISTPVMMKAVKNGMSSVVSSFPDDLTVSIKNGSASINQPEPYFIKIPDTFKNSSDSKTVSFENIIVIDTASPFSLDKFKQYSTFAYLTKNEVVMIGENGEIKILSLSKFGNLDITKAWILSKQASISKILPWLFFALVILAYVGIFIFEFIGSLIILLIYALAVWGILTLKGIKVCYGKSYKIALYASTLVMMVGLIGILIKPLNNFFVKLLVLIIVVYLNFDKTVQSPKIEEPTVVKEGEEIKA